MSKRARTTLVVPEHLERNRWVKRIAVLLAVVVLVGYVRYELSHDLPNPYWGTLWPMYNYTPEQGPPSASLLETRPDAIVVQFLTDYIHVAGTFPCIASLANYHGYDDAPDAVRNDPVLSGGGQVCRVHRPVVEVRITLVEMVGHLKSIPGIWQPDARVHFHLQYSDGEHLEGVMHLFADRVHSQPYHATYIHDNCWYLPASGAYFYPNQMQQVPNGLQYFDGTQDRCSGYD